LSLLDSSRRSHPDFEVLTLWIRGVIGIRMRFSSGDDCLSIISLFKVRAVIRITRNRMNGDVAMAIGNVAVPGEHQRGKRSDFMSEVTFERLAGKGRGLISSKSNETDLLCHPC